MLQQTETVEMSQEEKDRMLAMEAQDKELAKMLQERVSFVYLYIVISIDCSINLF